MPTKIFVDEGGTLNFDKGQYATIAQYESGDRCISSIFESLEPEDEIELEEGIFRLDRDLLLIPY